MEPFEGSGVLVYAGYKGNAGIYGYAAKFYIIFRNI